MNKSYRSYLINKPLKYIVINELEETRKCFNDCNYENGINILIQLRNALNYIKDSKYITYINIILESITLDDKQHTMNTLNNSLINIELIDQTG